MEKVIMADPEHADALNFLGYTLADEGRDLERAETLIENALRSLSSSLIFFSYLSLKA